MPEVDGQRLLTDKRFPPPRWSAGHAHAGRSFTIFDDLTGYTPADKLLETGVAFEVLLDPTAALAAKLHTTGLHHRDLYLCHFMAKLDDANVDLKLIDTARVRNLPGFLTRRRWIVKDIAQFIYSTHAHAITDMQRSAWLAAYAGHGGTSGIESAVGRKFARLRGMTRESTTAGRSAMSRFHTDGNRCYHPDFNLKGESHG